MALLESSSSAEYVAIERSGRFLSIATQNPFKLVFPVRPKTAVDADAAADSVGAADTVRGEFELLLVLLLTVG